MEDFNAFIFSLDDVNVLKKELKRCLKLIGQIRMSIIFFGGLLIYHELRIKALETKIDTLEKQQKQTSES